MSFRVLLCISVNVGAPLFLCLLSSGVPDDTPRLLFVYYLEYHSSFLRFPLRSLLVSPVHPVLPFPFLLAVLLCGVPETIVAFWGALCASAREILLAFTPYTLHLTQQLCCPPSKH